jgi:ferredoxin
VRIIARHASEPGEPISVEGAPGERVLDLLDEEGSLFSKFSCRSASCGVCLVRVKTGALGLRPASADERETLETLEADPDQRLLCQVVLDGEEDVVFEL